MVKITKSAERNQNKQTSLTLTIPGVGDGLVWYTSAGGNTCARGTVFTPIDYASVVFVLVELVLSLSPGFSVFQWAYGFLFIHVTIYLLSLN